MNQLRRPGLGAQADNGRSWRANPAGSTYELSENAPWKDLLTLHESMAEPGPWFEQSYPGYRIALRLNRPVRMDLKLAGESVRSETFMPGDFCLLGPGVIEKLCLKDAGECLIATISPAFLAGVASDMAENHAIDVPSARRFRDPQIEYLLLALRVELENSCPAGRLYGESLSTALAAHVLRRYWRLPQGIPEYSDGLAGPLLKRVIEYITEHLEEDVSLRQLADLTHMSPYHFARMFKKSVGLSPHRYLTSQRIERAKKLLGDHRLGLAEVAYAVGFPSQSHFTVIFSRLVGTTPGAFRRQI